MLLYKRQRKKERKTVLFLIFEHSDKALEWRIDEMLNQSRMKARDEAQMKAPVRRLSQSSVGSSVQSLIQCPRMRGRREDIHWPCLISYSLLFILSFILLFISIRWELLEVRDLCQSQRRRMPETHENAEDPWERQRPSRIPNAHTNVKHPRERQMPTWMLAADQGCRLILNKLLHELPNAMPMWMPDT